MLTRRTSKLTVFIKDKRCGTLAESGTGAISFRYDPDYQGVPLSLSMPVGLTEYGDRIVRPYLMGLLPDEEATRAAIGARHGVSGDNPFRLLAHIGGDCPGAVRILPEEAQGKDGQSAGLLELKDSDIAALLVDLQENAAAAWVDSEQCDGRWSLSGCQAKVALCRLGEQWFSCKGSSASTHILKPGISGMNGQALVEYLSMRVASSIGLPAAEVSFRQFASEWAIVIERYDRYYNGERVERIHQEDFCQALKISPLRKYADQGGPNAPQIIELLKGTGGQARSNVYRFMLYLFFNYLIGATDAHAKNYSLVFLSPGDIRLAPLYDVASIAPYQSLSPRRRKPLRAAMSIGGENRFGYLTSENIEKMVADCGLEELDLSAELLIRQFAKMATMIPSAVTSEVERAQEKKFPDAHVIGEALEKEIAENCRRALAEVE